MRVSLASLIKLRAARHAGRHKARTGDRGEREGEVLGRGEETRGQGKKGEQGMTQLKQWKFRRALLSFSHMR